MAHVSLLIMNMVGSECSPCRLPLPVLLLERAMLFRCVVHPKGLNPFQAAKAWHLRVRDGLAWKEVRAQVRTINGTHPGQDAVEDAVARVEAQRHTHDFQKTGVAKYRYSRCGRAPLLSQAQKQAVVAFVKRWRHKRFCTANYIIRELKLTCKKKTIHRTLNEAGFHWRPVAKKGKLSEAQLAQRRVMTLLAHSPVTNEG